jgi:RNA 2',3'-cyclic 3'-phosphodiesterase
VVDRVAVVRLFVAIFPPEEARADLQRRLTGAVRHGRRPGVRLTPVERWHISLNVLGEVPEARLPEVENALAAVPRPGRFPLRLAGCGVFGKAGSNVLWSAVEGDLAALKDLHTGVRSALATHDLPHDGRPLIPHMTVAYARSVELRAVLADYGGPTWTADAFALVQSRFADGGGYAHLSTWPLAG